MDTGTGDGGAGRAAARTAALWRRVRWGAAVFCLVQFSAFAPSPGVEVPWPLTAVGVAFAAWAAAANAVATLVERHRPRPAELLGPARRDLCMVAADLLLIVGLVLVLAFEPASAVWALLVLPVLHAGLIGRLPWALGVWTAALGTLVVDEVMAVHAYGLPAQDPVVLATTLSFRAGLLLLVALVSGAHASVAHAHLAELHQARRQLAHDANHDDLTGLASRRLFLELASGALRRHEHGGGTVGVLFVDCDSFKMVNDRHGHAAGDAVLQQVAERLRSVADAEDTVARLGGDEFAVLVQRADREHDLTATAATVRRLLRAPYVLPGVAGLVPMSCSVGAAGAAERELLPDLLRLADLAMYADKRHAGAFSPAG